MWKLTRISSLQETKNLASHPLRKNPQSLVSKKMKMKEKEKTEQGSVYSIYLYIYLPSDYMMLYLYYIGCKGIYIKTFFQPSLLRNPMVGGLQGEEWKFIQKYLKKNIQKSRCKNIGKLQEHFAGEKWCLRDFADAQKGLRNHFATKG